MKYDRACSASGMFVVNNVMSFNDIWRKSCTILNNVLQKVTKLLLNTYTILPEPPKKIWNNFDRKLYIV